jgi:hypothetical protein
MSDTDHCKNLYLSQILPSLIKDISLSDRKRLFKTSDQSNGAKEGQEGQDAKGRHHQHPIRQASNHNRPATTLTSINPWLPYSTTGKYHLNNSNIPETDSIIPVVKGKYNDDANLRSETANHTSVGKKLKHTKTSSQLAYRPPLHFPKYIVPKKHLPCDELPFAFNGPIPVSTIKEFKKPTFLEKRMIQSVTGMSIDVLENISVKVKRKQVLQNEYVKNLKTVEKIKTETKLGKWILLQGKK